MNRILSRSFFRVVARPRPAPVSLLSLRYASSHHHHASPLSLPTNETALSSFESAEAQFIASESDLSLPTIRNTLLASIQSQPSTAALTTLCMIEVQLGNFSDAVEAGKKSLAIDGEVMETHRNLSVAYLGSNPSNVEKALEHAKKAVELDGDNANSRFNLAVVYEVAEDYDSAIRELEKCISLDVPFAEERLEEVKEKKALASR